MLVITWGKKMMSRYLLLFLLLASFLPASAQNTDRHIRERKVRKVLSTLSSDDMQGRKPLTPGIDKAAAFISSEFARAGLKPLEPGGGYLQSFSTSGATVRQQSLYLNDVQVAPSDLLSFPSEEEIDWSGTGAEIVRLKKQGGNAIQEFLPLLQGKKNLLVLADTSLRRDLSRLRNFRMQRMSDAGTVILAFHPDPVDRYRARVSSTIRRFSYANVVGVIPGKGRPDERVVFSSHYDHLGIGKAVGQDSIYNGANDDASGTTAVIALARYFSKGKQPERTLVFAAFTAEESGGYGSQYFSKQMPPEKVVAMFNVEMIGTESKWGRNSAYITGYEKTDFGKILQGDLAGTGFTFHPDPYPAQNLFYRSDNATLARLGVPAHTISTSKMDSEKFYHTVDDELATLDTKNMTAIIKAIAISSRSIVEGRNTPSRVQ